jgi:hypothetical protein
MLWSRQGLVWTDDHERTLRSLKVSEHGPGTTFPAWQNNLCLPPWAFREGFHVFKVSLGCDLWRRITIPGALPLKELAETIICKGSKWPEPGRFARYHINQTGAFTLGVCVV